MATGSAVPSVTEVSHLDEDTSKLVDYYTEYFEGNRTGERKDNAKVVSSTYYDLTTDFYEYGYGQSFHFAPLDSSKPLDDNLIEYEMKIANILRIKPGYKLLDIGCGVGGPARTIAKNTGAHITGLNCNEYQLRRARLHTTNCGLQNQCTFDKGDFSKMDMYEDNSFDGAYAIESTCHAEDLLQVYKEVYRVLKPGSLYVDSTWITTDKYEPGNPTHEKVIQNILIGNGLPELRTREHVLDKMTEAGLEIVKCNDDRLVGDFPWYTFLVGKRCLSLQSFRASFVGRNCTHYVLTALEFLHLVPAGTTKVHSVLITGADGLIAAGKLDIFTPMFRVVAKKPAVTN